jgi:hypothetical protein
MRLGQGLQASVPGLMFMREIIELLRAAGLLKVMQVTVAIVLVAAPLYVRWKYGSADFAGKTSSDGHTAWNSTPESRQVDFSSRHLNRIGLEACSTTPKPKQIDDNDLFPALLSRHRTDRSV